jgi:alpha-D-xyloside xylohydrolase
MAEELRGGLSFCMSGSAFWSHDIGGFNGTTDANVYKRWVAFGLLSTHSRLHGSGSYRVPWLFDEESVNVMRHFARLKNRLFPYLFAAAHDAREHGWPVMRSMFLQFPNDPACRYLDRQYMLGEALMIAPVFRADRVAEYYLPSGTWTDLLSGQTIEGGSWRSDVHDFMSLPLLVKENSIVPMSDNESEPEWRVDDPLTLNLFRIADGADLSVRLVDSDNITAGVRCRRHGERITVESDGGLTNMRVMLHGTRAASAVSNCKVREVHEGLLLDWIDPRKALSTALV